MDATQNGTDTTTDTAAAEIVSYFRDLIAYRNGQLAEQLHQLRDLDADSTCRDLPAWVKEAA